MSKAELSPDVLADLMALHGRTSGTSSGGVWTQGTSSHHTVAKREGKEDYHIAHFHHADDASFIDQAHKYMPLLIERLRALEANRQMLVEALEKALEAMEMQEKRESGEFHIPMATAIGIWRDSQDNARAALEQAKELT